MTDWIELPRDGKFTTKYPCPNCGHSKHGHHTSGHYEMVGQRWPHCCVKVRYALYEVRGIDSLCPCRLNSKGLP